MTATPKYLAIVAHYEKCLAQYGDSHLGVDWPIQEHVDLRYQIMLEVIKKIRQSKVSLLDFGCGASHLYGYIRKHHLYYIEYSGLDISAKFIALCKQKYPSVQYYCMDILEDTDSLPAFDYVVLNGVFTEKCSLSYSDMLAYFFRLLTRLYAKTNVALAFNVMSSHVDWERDDLFHLPLDTLATFLTKELSRHFVVRNDYGLYEYTTYVYRRH